MQGFLHIIDDPADDFIEIVTEELLHLVSAHAVVSAVQDLSLIHIQMCIRDSNKIRRKIADRFPDCKQAFLPKGKALKNGNVGVENATPEDIIEALGHAHCTTSDRKDSFTEEDLFNCGLIGCPEAKERRERLGNLLSIGYGNSKTFLKKLNQFNITKEDFYDKVKEL